MRRPDAPPPTARGGDGGGSSVPLNASANIQMPRDPKRNTGPGMWRVEGGEGGLTCNNPDI